MTSRKNVGDIRHLVVFRVMIEVCDTGLNDDQYGDLLSNMMKYFGQTKTRTTSIT